jgi:hypothetical protein
MGKQELIKTITRILMPDYDLKFLLQLKEKELETLLACIRDRMDKKD